MLNANMRERSSQMASQRSQSAQLKALMDQKSSGRIRGIVGRLGDLGIWPWHINSYKQACGVTCWHWWAGAIDDKYDIAISTACGPLDNIVVDTLKTGEQCVEYLKQANLGVCTFILLEKMDQWVERANRPIKTYVAVKTRIGMNKNVSDNKYNNNNNW